MDESPTAPIAVVKKKMRRSDYSLQEWIEYQRALERGYDAKRRAKKREQGSEMTIDERRIQREEARRRADPPPSAHALDTVILALQGLEKAAAQREEPAYGALAELEEFLKKKVAHLRTTIQLPPSYHQQTML